MKYLEAICLVLLTAAAMFVLGELGLFVRDARQKVIPQAVQLLTDADRSAIIVGATAANIEKGTRKWQKQEIAVADQALRATNLLNADLQDLGTTISAASSLMNSQQTSLAQLEISASNTISETGSSLASIAPQVAPILAHLDQASTNLNSDILAIQPAIQNANDATKNLAGVAADSREVSDHYKQIILHPVRTAWSKVYRVWQLAVGTAQISTAVK